MTVIKTLAAASFSFLTAWIPQRSCLLRPCLAKLELVEKGSLSRLYALNIAGGLVSNTCLSALLIVLLAWSPVSSSSEPAPLQDQEKEEFAEFNIGLEPAFSAAVRITRSTYLKGSTQRTLGIKHTVPHSSEAWVKYYTANNLYKDKFIVLPNPTSLPGPFTIGIYHNSAGTLEDWETTLVKAGGQKIIVSLETLQGWLKGR